MFTIQLEIKMQSYLTFHNIKKILVLSFLLIPGIQVLAQEQELIKEIEPVKIDSLYREDQFFFNFTFNTLQQKPDGLSQNKFSTGFSGGFLRDMPINRERTIAIATGLGLTYNNYIQNLTITGTSDAPVYAISDDYNSNKFAQLLVDVPVEFRWRTSTYESYKFWRIYGGMKFSYLIHDRSVFNSDSGKVVITSNKDFNKFQYGIYASAGYNAINVYVYYGLNSLFKSASIADKSIDVKALNIGLSFYIL